MKAYKDDSNTTRIAVLETLTEQTHQTLLRLEKKMDEGFNEIKIEIKDVRGEIKDVRGEIKDSRSEIKDVRKEVNEVRKENTSHFRYTIFALLTLIGAPLMVQSIQLLTKLISGI